MLELNDFDPRLTLIDSAQVFHWKEEKGVFSAVTGGHLVKVEGGIASGADDDFLREYFDCTRDYGALKARFDEFPAVKRALLRLTGLRVLNQPAWETVVMAILTANNNTARIRSLVLKINEYCGERVGAKRAFPCPRR
ncbi:MAG: DNA glycosylase [Christensenellales bacterium]|jgi:N-glycosylase/DNA lyase